MAETIQWQTAAGGSAIDIAEAADRVSDFRVNGTPLLQPFQGVRAATVRHKGRGNLATRISFLVTYAPAATAEAAKLAAVARLQELQPTFLTHELLEGVFGSSTWQLADAALESVEFSQTGTTIFGRFSFVGGALTDAT